MSNAASEKISTIVTARCPNLDSYEELYKYLHQNGELSHCEKETAQLVATHLRKVIPSAEVKTNIGGHGLIAILRNGPGKTILIRADMDALPVQERTSLPYKSTKTMIDQRGVAKPVMHGERHNFALSSMGVVNSSSTLACGHDFHVICCLAAAESLAAAAKHWSGTCVFLFQPAEETITGARAMLEDGLFDEVRHGCPIPDALLAQHVIPLPAGFVGSRPGPALAASDSFKVTIHGRGGHGSMPHCTIDPVVIASHVVVRLQTIVSREVDPSQTAVVTVGSFQAGDLPNVIPDQAHLKLNIRTYNAKVRQKVIDSIERIVRSECEAAGCPKLPDIELFESVPFLHNDEHLHSLASPLLFSYFGHRYIDGIPAFPGSEDFGVLGAAINKPSFFWFFGGYQIDHPWEQAKLEEIAHQLPMNHSPSFAPVLQPTLRTGVHAMVICALAILGVDTETNAIQDDAVRS